MYEQGNIFVALPVNRRTAMLEQSMAQSSKGEEFWDNRFIEILRSLLSGKDVRFGDKQKQAKILQRCVILCQQPVTNAGNLQAGVQVC